MSTHTCKLTPSYEARVKKCFGDVQGPFFSLPKLNYSFPVYSKIPPVKTCVLTASLRQAQSTCSGPGSRVSGAGSSVLARKLPAPCSSLSTSSNVTPNFGCSLLTLYMHLVPSYEARVKTSVLAVCKAILQTNCVQKKLNTIFLKSGCTDTFCPLCARSGPIATAITEREPAMAAHRCTWHLLPHLPTHRAALLCTEGHDSPPQMPCPCHRESKNTSFWLSVSLVSSYTWKGKGFIMGCQEQSFTWSCCQNGVIVFRLFVCPEA